MGHVAVEGRYPALLRRDPHGWICFYGERLYGVVYVVRGDVLRFISLRKANQREVKSYVENAIKFQS